MADFQLRVTAETQKAEKDLQRLDRTANDATKERKLRIDVGEINKNFSSLEKNIKEAGNAVQSFYRVSKNIPGIGERVKEFESLAKGTANLARTAPASAAALRENAKAGSILATSLETAGGAAGSLINNLAKAGFALFAVKEAVGLVQAAFGGFFNETIGREIKLRETILKTQTTLASTSKVFRNGTEITDPYQKIVSLTGAVRENIDSIRVRSLELAGVTSNDVIEVFGIVAQQVSQIGGGLKEAEDLAIQFSAALGTFGIPLYQARQEIGSILRGDITQDSYLAKSLGITNEDVAKAKTQTGGVVKFLEERLSAAVAGQKIAAQGFSGVTSNIREIAELTTQAFGAGLLDPLLGGLTNVYTLLFQVAKQLQDIAKLAGTGLGTVLANSFTIIGGSSELIGGLGGFSKNFADQLRDSVESAFRSLAGDVNSVLAPIQNILEEVLKSTTLLVNGLANLAKGFASIQIENFKALVQVFSNLAEGATIFAAGLGSVLSAYGAILQVPFIQYLSQLSAQFKLLEAVGVKSAIQLGAVAIAVLTNWKPVVAFFQVQFARAVVALGAVATGIGAVFTQVASVIAAFAATLASVIPRSEALQASLNKLAVSLNATGASATQAGAKLTSVAGASGVAASKLGGAVAGFIKFNLIIFAVTAAITVLIDTFGRWQRAQEALASEKRATQALTELTTKYKDVGDSADAATKRAKEFREAIVSAQYSEATSRLEEIRKKLNDIRYEGQLGIQTWSEFFNLFNVGDTITRALGGNATQKRIGELIGEQARLREFQRKVEAQEDKKTAEDNIQLQAQNRVNLEKEIGDIRQQLENDLFQQRQNLAQKEVEIFRAAGELRIFQMEQANAKLIEGEEGASAAALESLNNYLSVRERGELDIEAAKKSLVIEVANLEREIANYRLENEKKIAEIRKRAGDYEKNIADYQRQAAGQTAAGTGGGAATFGSTGNVNNAAGWVHGHFQTNSGSLNDLISDVIPVLKGLLDKGIPVELSDGTKIQSGKDDSYYRRTLSQAAQQHRHSGDGRSIDLFVPEGTKVPVPLTDISGNTGRGGITGGLPGTGKSWVGHLAPGSKAGGAPAMAPPKAPTFDDIGGPAVEKYAEAVRGVASALERANSLQAALTGARTAAAFEAIAKAAFPKVALEDYENQAIELTGTLDALRGISADLYDPEQIRIAVEQKSKELIAERERGQILEEAGKRLKEGQITQTEFDKLTAQLAERQKKYNVDLAKEAEARKRNLELTKQQNAVESLKRATGAIRFDVQRAGFQAQATMAQAFAGDDSTALRRIEAEQRIAEERIRLEQDGTKTTADVNRELTAFAEATRAAATELGAMDEQVKKFAAQMSAIREASSAITDGYKGFAQTVLNGGDIKEAVGQMTKSITEKLTGMFLDAAFKPIEDMFVKTLQDVFGLEDPMKELQEQNNVSLGLNTDAINANTAALQSAAQQPNLPSITTPGGGTSGEGSVTPQTAASAVAGVNATSAAVGALGETAKQTAQQADAASKTGKENFSKFTGAMVGVATGALAITGAIQALQDSKGGTYGTLMGIAGILGGLGSIVGGFASLGKKAVGGPVTASRPYIVGEMGPELFVPLNSGSIIPNNMLRDNRAALSSSSTGESIGGTDETSDEMANTMAAEARMSLRESNRLQETRVQLMNQRMDTERRYERERLEQVTAGAGDLRISYESQVINNVEYVTREQAERMSAQSAVRGRELAIGALQNSVKTRKRVGIS